jgi:magnesium-transporting ATPase (P-type)
MENVTFKKILISYCITSVLIFFISAAANVAGVFGNNMGTSMDSMSIELFAIMQLVLVLLANSVLHIIFYYGGFSASPILRGVGIGAFLGLTYFIFSAFALNIYDIHGESLMDLSAALGGRVFEYAAGGIATAAISVSDIHRWGILRAF